jgi:metallo-beta-lactamase family protein
MNDDHAHPVPDGRPPLRLPREVADETGAATIRFLGAARTTTGSLHRIRLPGGDLLLECGMYQGHRAEAEKWNRDLPVDVRRVRAVVLSHAHIDHSGSLPNLVRMGFGGAIWCTEATRDLLPVMLLDAAHIQEFDAERLNRMRPGQPPHVPLYTTEDAEKALRLLRGVPYGRDFEPMPGVVARFVDAGHILGSAAIHLTLRADGRETKLGFTGDLGRRDVPILRDPEPLGDVDWYMSESTYGDRDHEDAENVQERLRAVVARAVSRGGKVIIPAFAVGRTQVILYLLAKLRRAGKLPDVPVYVDSPMAVAATKVFQQHREVFDEEARELVLCCAPLVESASVRFVSTGEESRRLNDLKGPAIIISASGMVEAGRILHHVQHHAPDKRNIVLFVGFQAENTLGRRIVEGERDVKIYGEKVHIAAEVESIEGLSAHADRRGLLAYAKTLARPPKRTFLVHGEDEKVTALATYMKSGGMGDVVGPKPGEWFRLL